jgi:hypothetical protein
LPAVSVSLTIFHVQSSVRKYRAVASILALSALRPVVVLLVVVLLAGASLAAGLSVAVLLVVVDAIAVPAALAALSVLSVLVSPVGLLALLGLPVLVALLIPAIVSVLVALPFHSTFSVLTKFSIFAPNSVADPQLLLNNMVKENHHPDQIQALEGVRSLEQIPQVSQPTIPLRRQQTQNLLKAFQDMT